MLAHQGVVQKSLVPGYTERRQSRAGQGTPHLECYPDLNHAHPKAADPEPPPAGAKPDYRAGRTQFGGWVPKDAKRQIDIWAAQHGKTRQWVLEEALNLFFIREGLPRLARMKEE